MARRKEPESAVYVVLGDDGVVLSEPVAIHPDVAVPENWVRIEPGQVEPGWRTSDGGRTWEPGEPLPEPRDELEELRDRLAALEARLPR